MRTTTIDTRPGRLRKAGWPAPLVALVALATITLSAAGADPGRTAPAGLAGGAGPLSPGREGAAAQPPTPTGLTASAGDRQVDLQWMPAPPGLATGYRVYRPAGTLISGPEPLFAPVFTDTTARNGVAYEYVVVSVNESGDQSAPATVTAVIPEAVTIKVNFADQVTAPPAGYQADYGEAYGLRPAARPTAGCGSARTPR